jgi:putative ABC transport system permease protein
MGVRFWLRWSARDLRKRAAQVVAIAAIISLGTGVYAGLGTTSVWRLRSLDASAASLSADDLHVSVLGGLMVDRGRAVSAARGAGRGWVTDVEARLLVHVPVTATRRATGIPAAGEVLGVDLATGPRIDRWQVTAGRNLVRADAGAAVALLDEHFAHQHGLADSGTLRIGGLDVDYVGLALSPEYLDLTTTSGEAIQGQATRAVLFAPLALAERLAGTAGQVDDVVVRVAPGTDVRHAADAMSKTLARTLPRVPITVTARRDEPSIRALYDEVKSERHLFDVFAIMILAGAGFAAFNLTKRVVEAQRRDIGIAMSLGLPRRKIAIRTVLLASAITVLGVAFGVLFGWAIATWVLSVIRDSAPLPVWQTPFQLGLFARAALLGLLVPLAASAFPVWRAVRVRPVNALLPPHLRSGRHRLTRVLGRLPLPGRIDVQAPVRRILRAPARSVLTIFAIAFIMAPLLAALGATDSASATISSGEHILNGPTGDRLLVDLAGYQAASSSVVRRIEDSSLVRTAEPALHTGGYLVHAGTTLGVSISMVDLAGNLAAPAAIAVQHVKPGGIVISAKAAADLQTRVGQSITFRHPLRVGTGFRFVNTTVPVRAVHASPYRFVVFMDLRDAGMMGLEGIVNAVEVEAKANVPMERLQQSIAAMPGVASALPASSLSRTMRDLLSLVGNLFVVLQIVIASLAFLVAFNASNIAAEERAREHATMFAFGVPLRRVALMSVAESLILGVVGVALGLGIGAALLRWILDSIFPAAVPDLAVIQAIAPGSYLLTVVIGVGAAAIAPLLNIRRLRAMNLPSTLRYVE